MKRLRIGMAAATAAVLVAGVTGCGAVATNPLSAGLPAVFSDSAFGCVDARGGNSTGEQILSANTEYTKRAQPVVEKILDDAPARSESSKQAQTGLSDAYLTADDLSDLTNDTVVEAKTRLDQMPVRDGGDAAFAEVACDTPPEALLDDLPMFRVTRYRGVGDDLTALAKSTPHQIRAIGRTICLTARPSDGSLSDWEGSEEYISDIHISADEQRILEDPAAGLQEMLETVDDIEDDIGSDEKLLELQGGEALVRWDLQQLRTKLRSYQSDPSELADLVNARVDLARAAFKFQCPDLR